MLVWLLGRGAENVVSSQSYQVLRRQPGEGRVETIAAQLSAAGDQGTVPPAPTQDTVGLPSPFPCQAGQL